jgi:Tfp pilus assembly protein PilF
MPWCRRPAELASLRFNRASARIRTGRLDAATGDLFDCLELMPGFTEARAQLVSVLTTKGALAEARAHLATLRQGNAPAALLSALEAQLDEAVRRGP